ncbi:hypothetical protein C8N35_1011010 [Breoghania corrubedonensis]|uniref:DUF7662 domain-containing protein n=1 Tax=Breoghania corrubedonensis TaxID=665038 RepID=A0A2T5VGT0_9HYPH|nr:hypothetical protein [Breoghania corrubedonensis]PTW62961.1 hypothetical protein C8N35_1011010 [Breoghania corrubedonensis]
MAKYDPLKLHLAGLQDFEWTAGFDEIERILGSALPASATAHRTWWANSGGLLVHQQAWLTAGWRVRQVDISRRNVTFQRTRLGAAIMRHAPESNSRSRTGAHSGSALVSRSEAASQAGRAAVLPAAMRKALETSRKPLNLSARIDWSEIGPGRRDGAGWQLPDAGQVPALCRFHIFSGDGHRVLVVITRDLDALLRAVEAGEEDGGGTARVREVAAAMAGADHVVVDAATPGQAWILVDGRGHKADLGDDGERWLVAWAADVGNRQAGLESVLIAS